VSGSDAHGTPIVVSAEKGGRTPEEVAFKYRDEYVKLLERWEINLDNYTVTHNPLHIKFCQEFYKRIFKNGYVFKARTEQPYCKKCERFLPDRFVEGECPRCGWPEARGDQCTNPECERLLTPTELNNPRCAVCGATPTLKETVHWYFDLPRLGRQVKKFLEDCPILSESARSFAGSVVQEGLTPRPITRDLEWGIPADPIFEGAEGKVLYVWAENILGYLSATKEWNKQRGNPTKSKNLWQARDTKTVFCIGKDNTIFHAIIFPALLIAAQDNYVLPYAMSVTEFITFKGQRAR
jgi:methionyl-tRNA synthetase